MSLNVARIVALLLCTSLAESAHSFAGEPRDVGDWEQVMTLSPGTNVWIRTRTAPLTELVVAQVTEDTIRAGVVSEMKASKASEEEILSRCAAPSDHRLVVGGEVVDLARLCRTLRWDEILEVHTLTKRSPLRSILIGSGVTAAIMFAPCGVAPQANGSAAGCRVGAAGFGALIGWAIHGLRRGERVLIYEAKEAEPAWDDLARDTGLLEEVVRKMEKDAKSSQRD